MPDREKVIKGLELCTFEGSIEYCIKEGCPYLGGNGVGYCIDNLMRDALALLKAQEQEPVAPIRCSAHAQGADDVWYECGKCGKFLGVNPYSKQVCPKCGKAVKWG